MGKILIDIDDEIDEKLADALEAEARRIFGVGFLSLSWFWNFETEDRVSELFAELLQDVVDSM